jgi:ferrous iron transport protein B
MADVAAARGLTLNPQALASALGIPVVTMAASKGEGLADLKAVLARLTAVAAATRPALQEVPR